MAAKEPASNDGSWVNPLAAHGFHIGGVKYITIKSDDRSVYGKKVRSPLVQLLVFGFGVALFPDGNNSLMHLMAQGKEGIVCVKTKQAILIAHYPESTQPGEAAKITEQLADYLIGVGY